MEQFAALLRHFIVRDVVYIVGGGSVITSLLYLFNRLDAAVLAAVPTPFWLLAAGIAHAVGYAIQNSFSLLHGWGEGRWRRLRLFVTSGHLQDPGWLLTWLFAQFVGREWDWTEADAEQPRLDELCEREGARAEFGQYHRIVMLRHVGATMGSCGVVSTTLLSARAYCTEADYDLALAIFSGVTAVVLLMLGWLKTAQQTDFVLRAHQHQSLPWAPFPFID